MIKKTIEFENLDGELVTEDFYFHLTKLEAYMLEEVGEGQEKLTDKLKRIIETKNTLEILEVFRSFISVTVGRRVDGNQFLKTPEITSAFINSDAFEAMLIEFLKDARQMAAFITGILPKSMHAEAKQMIDQEGILQGEVVTPQEKKFEEYTQKELLEMPQDEFDKLVGSTDPRKMTKDMLVLSMQRKIAPGTLGKNIVAI